MEEATRFMTKKELELFKKKMIDPRKPKAKTVAAQTGCQTKLS